MKRMVTFIRVGVAGLLVLLIVALPHDTCAQSSPTTLPPLSNSIGVWGDCDNDGLVDVLLAGTIQGVAGIPDGRFTRLYHNAGGGLFQDTGVVLSQLDNVSAAWGDYDNDGDLDLLVSGVADGTNGPVNVTAVYRNDGSNHFTLLPTSLEPLAQGSVAWVDYDNDGALDIFVTGLRADGTNWVSQLYHNNGDGTFSLAPVSLPAIANGRGSWGDCDNDGDADLLLAGSDATYLLRNDGGIFASASVSIPAQHQVISPWGDFDGDGDLDFITSSGTIPSVIFGPDYHPSLTRNDGSGVLSSSFDYSLDMWLFSASWGDIDNSGRACVVVSGWVPLVPGGGVWGSATKVFIYLGSSWQEVFTLGGAVYCDSNGPEVSDCIVSRNSGCSYGAGVFKGTLINCVLTGNNASGMGGGAYLSAVVNCTLVGNSACYGGGAAWSSLTNCICQFNSGGSSQTNWYTSTLDHSCAAPLPDGLGNTAADPLLVNLAGGDFRLLAGSPCVNAGTNGSASWGLDLDGLSRVVDGVVDMGAYEVQHVPWVVAGPFNQSAVLGSNALFTVSTVGDEPLVCRWQKDGVDLADDGRITGAATRALAVSSVSTQDLGGYRIIISNAMGVATSTVASLTILLPPTITVQPADQIVPVGAIASFGVLASGTATLAYQWRKDGANLANGGSISGATSATLQMANASSNYLGSYDVLVSNPYGVATSTVATLTLVSLGITNQPASRSVPAGTNVTFVVGAAGFTPIGYQWRFNQADLAGQTNTSLALTNVQSGNAGDYVVMVTNAYSALTSAVATLTVVPTAPVVTTQTASRVVSVGQNVSFSVAARGSEPMSCQWQFNGADLPGATGFTLALTNVNASFSGAYRAAVSNAVGIGFSTNVTLVVSPVLIWGLTNNPQLQLNAAIPATATNVMALAAGGSIDPGGLPCMALRADGTIATWGYYSRDQAPPTNAVDLVAISLGDAGSTANNLVLRADGTVVSWTGSTKPPQPVALTNGNIVAVAAGGAHQLALRDDGTVIAWGSNTSGQTNVPANATNVIAIAAGTSHSLALRADGKVVGWGLNTSGQATALNGAANVVAIAAGGNQSLALLADGSVVGQAVLNTPTVAVTYGPPPGNTNNKIAIAAGRYHSLALGMDRTVNGWGATNYGQITIPAYTTNVVAIAAGADDSLALVRDPFAPPIPPRIARPRLGRQVIAGQSVVFNALAVGGLPLRYQWYRDAAPVPGQTNAWLAVTNVLPGDGGNLQLVAMNDFGSVTSAVAVVIVSIPQPQLTASGVAGGGFRIFFQSAFGLLYVTEYKASLGAGAWTELERRYGVGRMEMVTDTSAGDEARFYRIRVE